MERLMYFKSPGSQLYSPIELPLALGYSVGYIQWLPEVSEHPREPYGNTSFSRRSHYLNFRRNATNFCLELAR